MKRERKGGFRSAMYTAMFLIVIVIIAWWIWLFPVTTTVFVVRHAEKAQPSANDPPLSGVPPNGNPAISAAGVVRAEELAHVLRDAGVDAVFATRFQRTQLTAALAAGEAGVSVVEYDTPANVVATVLADHAGQTVLIVGHSNTVDDLVAELGAGTVAELAEQQFDRLFVVNRHSGGTHLTRLRYGADTP